MTITDEQRERERRFVKEFILLLNRYNIPVERMSAAIVAIVPPAPPTIIPWTI